MSKCAQGTRHRQGDQSVEGSSITIATGVNVTQGERLTETSLPVHVEGRKNLPLSLSSTRVPRTPKEGESIH